MMALRWLANAALMMGELAAVAGLAMLATRMPLVFAAVTALMALALGTILERKRLLFELPFYIEGESRFGRIAATLVGLVTSLAKAVMVGFLALLTFSGTNTDRRFWIALAMAVTIYAGISLLRRLWLSFGVRAARWGYFRLALPLGVLFALGVAGLTAARLVETPNFAAIMRQIILDVPVRPNLAEASELLFQLKLYIDTVIVGLLATMMSKEAAQLLGVVLSVNALAGLVAAVWAVVIGSTSVWLEARLSRTAQDQGTKPDGRVRLDGG